jgi:gliding motility-associated-like protein
VASPEVTTEYTVTVTDGNGCSATDKVLVRVELNCGDVFVPDAFSPNGDGNNDEFKVFGNCIKTINLKIYDRWGNKIFETSDVTESWKGDYKGKELNSGTYTYVYSGTLVTGESIQGKGVVVLIK